MTAAPLERIAAARLAEHLSPIVPAHVDALVMDLGMTADEIDAAAQYLERNRVMLIRHDDTYRASGLTWNRCQRFARIAGE